MWCFSAKINKLFLHIKVMYSLVEFFLTGIVEIRSVKRNSEVAGLPLSRKAFDASTVVREIQV
jgi:hypothetical protein